MPVFSDILKPEEIDTVAHYAASLSGGEADAAKVAAGKELFVNNCASCHGEDAREIGSLARQT